MTPLAPPEFFAREVQLSTRDHFSSAPTLQRRASTSSYASQGQLTKFVSLFFPFAGQQRVKQKWDPLPVVFLIRK
jgi:hypothetical protein